MTFVWRCVDISTKRCLQKVFRRAHVQFLKHLQTGDPKEAFPLEVSIGERILTGAARIIQPSV